MELSDQCSNVFSLVTTAYIGNHSNDLMCLFVCILSICILLSYMNAFYQSNGYQIISHTIIINSKY